ncbi:hypothetical protein chiPu_0013269 [Chiloscyllium punctatum]|uniref:Uncharacterized protein n=1 Tax=Chiloscyllium punctatum TaxID=137246 RepID=A0A401SWN7_CHIPU|nr:hypothetical protein [Chiloscyllium punctatum]
MGLVTWRQNFQINWKSLELKSRAKQILKFTCRTPKHFCILNWQEMALLTTVPSLTQSLEKFKQFSTLTKSKSCNYIG